MARKVSTVAVLGGTHGNETNGVYVVDALLSDPAPLKRPSVASVEYVHTNTRAIDAVTRFIDVDLNRLFRAADLADQERVTCWEHVRAKELDAKYGPKPAAQTPPLDPNEQPAGALDLCVDLHTTTSRMGCTLIVPCRDHVSLRIAAYALKKMEADPAMVATELPCRILYLDLLREEAPYICTMGRHAMMIECGPTPWGLVRHDMISMMHTCLGHIMDYVHDAVNKGKGPLEEVNGVVVGPSVPVMKGILDPATGLNGKIPAPCNEHGRPTACFHPSMQDRDYKELRTGDPVYIHMDGRVETYDGRFGDCVSVHFVNEAAYYLKSSGLGFEVSQHAEVATL
eukprot:TRINITY_DN10778_c0_g1_i1.p1 TRINITY_DN10778_c0_g1~~TRINITY_DN10778_c0_g1_i1.p1  ORF type:complete len:388 (+),score=111.54 TRINITY_DN10778_c0_g1_i1:144-1166(+)